ncbi:tissue factor-like [Lampetra fluviatilis]
MESVTTRVAVTWLLLMVCAPPGSGSGSLPVPTNLSFVSVNFKTLLEWQVEDTGIPVTYDVELLGATWPTWKQKAECTDSIEMTCDLTSIMADPRLSYRARVRAIPGGSSAVHTVPWVMSPSFVPYDDTELGKPQFEAVGRNGSIQLKVADLITPYFNIDGSHKTMGDIYTGDLHYHLTYWKDGSSGRKEYQSRQAAFMLTGLDEGELYCFHVQLLVDVDNTERRGEESDVKCARSGLAKPDYAWIFLVAAGIAALIIGVALIVLIVWLCHHCRQQRKSERNGTVVSYTAAAAQRD